MPLKLEVVTPEQIVISEEADFVVVPGTDGYLGFLPGHAPLVSSLNIGPMKIKKGNDESLLAISGGFVEIKNDKVVVLADTAERAEDIDIQRARAAKERAEQRLAARTADIDILRAEAALKRALTRLKVAGKE